MHACVAMCMFGFRCVQVSESGQQVPMVGKGVVEVLMAMLTAVQIGDTPALPLQEAACTTLASLADAADIRVRF